MSIYGLVIYKFILLLMFNISFINNSPRPPNKEARVEEEPKLDEAMNLMHQFTSEWEEKMEDYNYEYLYYIPINPREQEIYFENVTSVPTTFKGAYFLSDESANKIEFYVKDSDDRIIHKAIGHHDIFEFNIALLIGLVTGTLSSIFIASQLWLEIEKRNIKNGTFTKEDNKKVVLDEVDEFTIRGINS